MNFIVKNTTKSNLLDVICPYKCRGCGCVGEVLCICCKKYILDGKNEDFWNESDGLPFKKVWVCGWRDELLGRLVKEFKFDSARRIGDVLAEIICEVVSDLDDDIVVVPLPTIRRHIRERGLDHTLILAKKIAKMRNWQVDKLLVRLQNKVQVGSDAIQRQKQAKEAYGLAHAVMPNQKYLLIDDVWTTGASMCEAAKILRNNGAKNIFGVVLVKNRQKLFGDTLDASFNSLGVETDGIQDEVNDCEGED